LIFGTLCGVASWGVASCGMNSQLPKLIFISQKWLISKVLRAISCRACCKVFCFISNGFHTAAATPRNMNAT
jgi:hypothetical protein